MQVTETLSSGLKREFKVVVNAAELDKQLNAKLLELSARANIKGFRPGKVPVPHLRRVYGKSAMAEVVQKTIDEQTKQVPTERNLKPAYQPEVKLPEDEAEVSAIMDGKSDLSFSLAFEVIPVFDLQDHSGLELTRHTVEVMEDHIGETLKRLTAQAKTFEPRAEGKAAKKGDRLTINFVGKIDGAAFEGGTAEGVPLEIGSGQFIPGFEDQLTGAKTGEDRTVKVTFPESYGVKNLAGKAAEFAVKVTAVEEPKETPIDDEFAKKMGFENLAKLKDMIKSRAG
ncbi:MAG: trigger factor, partial [Rhizobiales bacterium]|nr:trigger factor [Hyphomicrobiales bacterium]